MYKIPAQRGGIMATAKNTDQVEQLSDEVNQIWTFTQRFIDEQSIDFVTEVQSVDYPLRRKFDKMDWLARNAEFLSPESITKCLITFKDLYKAEN